MESDFIKKGTNEEEMRGGASTVHHFHAHGPNCEDMGHSLYRKEHEEPSEVTEKDKENKGEHVEPAEIEENLKGEHAGAYPGMIRHIR